MAVTEPGSILDLLRKSSKPAALVVALGVVGATGYYFWQDNRQAQLARAERSYVQAQLSLSSGNRALAQTDLQRVIDANSGTVPGVQAAALLATLKYEEGKHAEGTALVERALRDAPEYMRPSLHALLAAGYEDQKKLAEAAAEYRRAAEATRFPLDRQKFLADAARSLQAAGQPEEARKIWTELADDELGQLAGEARVRLGELNARPAGRS